MLFFGVVPFTGQFCARIEVIGVAPTASIRQASVFHQSTTTGNTTATAATGNTSTTTILLVQKSHESFQCRFLPRLCRSSGLHIVLQGSAPECVSVSSACARQKHGPRHPSHMRICRSTITPPPPLNPPLANTPFFCTLLARTRVVYANATATACFTVGS